MGGRQWEFLLLILGNLVIAQSFQVVNGDGQYFLVVEGQRKDLA